MAPHSPAPPEERIERGDRSGDGARYEWYSTSTVQSSLVDVSTDPVDGFYVLSSTEATLSTVESLASPRPPCGHSILTVLVDTVVP